MAEEKPDSENPGDSVRKYPPFSTTAEAEVAKGTGEVATYTVKDQPPGHRAPNTALLVLSWGVFTIGLYFLYAAGMGYYKDNVTEAKLAITVLLGILTIPVGIFLRRTAYHGFRKAFEEAFVTGSDTIG
jgi:hypothetical protein